ncbi:transportin [Heterostelium album PN500]|uniref:Transportin n=1 Tax=Heterostelium pallidum (strain ATCC 26659 / Pp 5 / PN500) TaxID=670386 RepID=D3AY61_HETP5|nr:transportin [Heterostelium album PN500]EFA85888.1 transportin [Heterostelium album PN500]|eukprot:XP_020437994.1 transportin [Heterostelium album PN500]
MDWVPNQEGLNQLIMILKQTNSPNQETQRNIHTELNNFHQIPDYNNYLTFIFKLTNLEDYVRSVAGLILKQNIKAYYPKMPRKVQNFIKAEVLPILSDPNQKVRQTVANIITTLILKSSFESPNPVYRRRALASLHYFIPSMPGALLINMDSYLNGIFSLSEDPNPDVRVKVCRTLVLLIEIRIEFLMPHIKQVIMYMLHASRDQNEDVALEACEFWTAIAETPNCKSLLREFLPTLIPILLNGMVYSSDEFELLDVEDDAAIPDRPQDIKPFIGSSKQHSSGPSGAQGFVFSGQQQQQQQQQEEEDEDDEDDDDFVEEDSWSLRKSSALALDTLSTLFDNQEYLAIALPLIEQKMNESNPWIVRESAILALGAIAEGCLDGLAPHLKAVVPYLINTLNDPKPLVRSITCWALSRYSYWISTEGPEFLYPLIVNLLNRILDNNKRVQEAACSAFATIEEDSDAHLKPFLPDILATFVKAFHKYQAKNLLILYDAISTLAKVVGKDLNKPEYINILLPPLLEKFNNIDDRNKTLLPLLQCLTPICSSIGIGLNEIIVIFYNRAVRIIIDTLTAYKRFKENPDEYEEPDKDFVVCCLDLISGLAEGVGTSIESLVTPSNLPLVLLECMRDHQPDVRQSAFALLGDMSKICILHFKPYIPEYIPILITNLYPDLVPVCNNACWALGEIAVRMPMDVKPFVKSILEKLIPIMQNVKLHRNIRENTSITLGRMGLVAPEVCAPHIDEFVQCWCMAIRGKVDDQEKDSAFRGMWMIISTNPTDSVKHLVYICDAIASWNRLEQDLNDAFKKLLHVFKSSIGDHWPQYYIQFPEQLRKILDERYQLDR